MIFVLLALFLTMWVLFIYNVIRNKRLYGFYFKGFTSLAFIFIFAYGCYRYFIMNDIILNDLSILKFAIFVFIGLICGLIGDLFLEMMHVDPSKDKGTIIFFGTLIFMIGHVFYFTGLTQLVDISWISFVIGAGVTVIVYFGGKVMKLNMGKLEYFSYLYAFALFTVVGQSIVNAFVLNFSMFSLSFMIGAIFFGISDLFLAPLYYGGETRNSIVVANLATYYLGQYLIALVFLFL